jgi:hypothetical protein
MVGSAIVSSALDVSSTVWVRAVGRRRVEDRVAREKSSKRSRSTTVRPTRSAARSRPRVLVARECVEVPARRSSERRHERLLAQRGDLLDGRDSEPVQLLCGDSSNPPEPLDGERVEKCQLALRRHEQQPVRLCNSARHLRQELRPRDSDRDRQADALAHGAPQAHRDLAGAAGNPAHAANVEERLVDREPLHQRRGVVEYAIEVLARFGVG